METTKEQAAPKKIPVSSIPATIGLAALHCIACGSKAAEAAPDQSCPTCGDLLEVVYSCLNSATHGPHSPSADALKALWCNRKSSLASADQSGVWRFREMLPILAAPDEAVTLREGNTPIYQLPRCARSAGVENLLAKHQGMNPTGSF